MRVPVVGLLGRPGQRKELRTSVPPDVFGEEPWGPAVDAFEGEIELDLVLESVSGGVLVRGPLRATARGTCARCLTATVDEWEVDVTELHRSVAAAAEEEDGEVQDLDYLLVEGDTQLELDQMVRDALVVGQPVRVLCREDCAGLCPQCGADRNTEPCDHDADRPVDPRWEALRGLRLPDPDGAGDGTPDGGPVRA
jgi:uncharacterized protein